MLVNCIAPGPCDTEVSGIKLPHGMLRHARATLYSANSEFQYLMRSKRANPRAPFLYALLQLLHEGKSPQALEYLASLSPLKRLGTADDIARVASFLAGPDSLWVNGQVLYANGGAAM